MIAFGCAMTSPDKYEAFAKSGIDLVAEPDSKIHLYRSKGSIFRNYNMILDLVKDEPDLEALVLFHQDSEIVEPDFCDRIRAAMADPEVAIVGCIGVVGARSIAYWEGSEVWGSFTHRYYEYGGGDIPGLGWQRGAHMPPYARTGEVDTVDGFVLCLSPWAVRNLRFDETLGKLHGYDLDICLQAREQGKKVVVADFRVIHHHSLALINDVDGWVEAHMKVAEKWDGRMGMVGQEPGDWKERARRAEARAEAEKMIAGANVYIAQARVNEARRPSYWLHALMRKIRRRVKVSF
jgi:hypothetical protein